MYIQSGHLVHTGLSLGKGSVLDVCSACTTCCLLNGHGKDVEASTDWELDEVGLQKIKQKMNVSQETLLVSVC